MSKPSYVTLAKAVAQFVEAFGVSLDSNAAGKTIETYDWTSTKHQVFFAADYPALYQAVKYTLESQP